MANGTQQESGVRAGTVDIQLLNPRHEVQVINRPLVELTVSYDVKNNSSETFDDGVYGTVELEDIEDAGPHEWGIPERFYPGTTYTLNLTWQITVETDSDYTVTQVTEVISPSPSRDRYTATIPGVGDGDGDTPYGTIAILGVGGLAAYFLLTGDGGDDGE